MVNPWFEHVKDYAAKNNVPYNKAITLAKASYKQAAIDEPKPRQKTEMKEKKRRRNAKGQYQ